MKSKLTSNHAFVECQHNVTVVCNKRIPPAFYTFHYSVKAVNIATT